MQKLNDVPVILIVDDVKKKSDILNTMILDMGYIPKQRIALHRLWSIYEREEYAAAYTFRCFYA